LIFELILIGSGALLSLLWCLRRYRTQAGWEPELRWAHALLPLALYCIFLIYLAKVVRMPYWDWNAARLAPGFSLLYGYKLYYLPYGGPMLCTLYGPVTYLIYLPAILARQPTAAILAAGAANVSLVLLFLFLLNLQGNWSDRRHRVLGLSGFVFCATALLSVSGTNYVATKIHADAPAVGFGLLSCLLLLGGDQAPGQKRLALSALFAALSIWTKQIEAPLVPAAMVYLAAAHGRKPALRFLLWVVALGGGLGILFGVWFGFKEMFFNMFVLPGRQPWEGDLGLFTQEMKDLLLYSAAFLLVILLASLVTMEMARRRGWEPGGRWRENRWTLLVLAGLFLIPTSVLGKIKTGGGENSFHTIYYFIAAASITLVHFARPRFPEPVRRTACRLLILAAAGTFVLSLPSLYWLRYLAHVSSNPEQEAYRFALAHPGEAWFPWNPIATLMAEGNLYHFEYGVTDREMAGYKPTNAEIRRNTPAHLRYIIYPKDPQSEEMLRFFPEFARRIELPELPGWLVYVREER
jgi:hypothetical protein